MDEAKYLLKTPNDGWFYGKTVKECIDEVQEYVTLDVKLQLRLKYYTIHKIGVPLSWATINRETTPKARCINPPVMPLSTPQVAVAPTVDDFLDW